MGCCASASDPGEDPHSIERGLLDNPHGQGAGDVKPPEPQPQQREGKGKKKERKKKERKSFSTGSDSAQSDGEGVSPLHDWERQRVQSESIATYAQKLIDEGDISDVGSTRRVSFLPPHENSPPAPPPLSPPAPPSPQPATPQPASPGHAFPEPLLSIDRCPACLSPAPARGLPFCPFCGKRMGVPDTPTHSEQAPFASVSPPGAPSPLPFPPGVGGSVQGAPVAAAAAAMYVEQGAVIAAEEMAEDMRLEAELDVIDRKRDSAACLGVERSAESERYGRAEQLLLDACETAALLRRELARRDTNQKKAVLAGAVSPLMSPQVMSPVAGGSPPDSVMQSLLAQLLREREHLAYQLSRMPATYLDPLHPHPQVTTLLASIKERDTSVELLRTQLSQKVH